MKEQRYDFETGQTDPRLPIGWDSNATLIARFEQPQISHALPTAATSSPTLASGPSSDASLTPSSPHPAKRIKVNDSAGSDVGGSAGQPPSPTWSSYQPRVLGTFSLDLAQLDSSPPLRYTSTLLPRIITPGSAPLYREPTLPLCLKPAPSSGGVRVVKPPVATLLHVAHRQQLLQDGAPLPDCVGLTFVAFRHSLQCMLDGRSAVWRVDVQRWGRLVLLRRCLDYSSQDPADIGHLFEAACTTGGGEGGFRVLVAGHVGRHSLVTSCEIDAVTPPLPEGGAALSAAQLLELKTVMADVGAKGLRDKQKHWWLQCWLAGIAAVKMGLKVRLEGGEVEVREVKEVPVDGLASVREKEKVWGKLSAMLTFLGDAVQEGRLYKLVRERKEGQEGHHIGLYELEGGMDTWPVWKEDGIEPRDAVMGEQQQQQQQQRQQQVQPQEADVAETAKAERPSDGDGQQREREGQSEEMKEDGEREQQRGLRAHAVA